jgi:hypothetical protein
VRFSLLKVHCSRTVDRLLRDSAEHLAASGRFFAESETSSDDEPHDQWTNSAQLVEAIRLRSTEALPALQSSAMERAFHQSSAPNGADCRQTIGENQRASFTV